MDTPGSSDQAKFFIADLVTSADLELGFQVSGGNRHAYVSCTDVLGSFVTVDVVVATDGLEHTLQAVVDARNLSLYMDGALLGSSTASHDLMGSFGFTSVTVQKGVPASSVYASKVMVSNCPSSFP